MIWNKVTGYRCPEELEIGVTTTYLRKNIVETEDENKNKVWKYEECQMLHDEYAKYLEFMNSPIMEHMVEKFEQQDRVLADTLLTQEKLTKALSAQDEALSAILLNQMGDNKNE